jgi:predicted DNA-binding transcriptional regulator AlpA
VNKDLPVFNVKQAGTYIGCSESVLRLWRSQGKGPRYFRAGKLVRYRRTDLDSWIEARLCEPVNEAKSSAGEL